LPLEGEKMLFGASMSSRASIWASTESGQQIIRTLRSHSQPVTALALSPRLDFVVSGSADKTVKLLDLIPGPFSCDREKRKSNRSGCRRAARKLRPAELSAITQTRN